MRTDRTLPYGGGGSTLQRPPQTETPWTETSCTETPWTETLRTETPLDKDPWTESPLDRDPPWTDRHLWKHNLRKLLLRAVINWLQSPHSDIPVVENMIEVLITQNNIDMYWSHVRYFNSDSHYYFKERQQKHKSSKLYLLSRDISLYFIPLMIFIEHKNCPKQSLKNSKINEGTITSTSSLVNRSSSKLHCRSNWNWKIWKTHKISRFQFYEFSQFFLMFSLTLRALNLTSHNFFFHLTCRKFPNFLSKITGSKQIR